ncbi:MAG: prepilin-type N-terminal cleavage/methylation domain-containing protein [Burkholderiales bacterium]|nr:prepilin-type N-terminal cleavage/methylation domain-containing protein [Burkholderiales bacterium]
MRLLCVLSRRGPSAPVLRLRGFTMIELIVVMAVIGLLLSIAVPRYLTALDRGKAQVQQQNLALMREAIDKYYGDNGRYPDALDDLVTKRYLRAIPIDPITEATDWVTVAPTDSKQSGRVYDVQSAKPASQLREAYRPPDSEGSGSVTVAGEEGAASDAER